MSIYLTLITEDLLSRTVAEKILKETGPPYKVVNKINRWNKDEIRQRIKAINQSARGQTYFVLTDQDRINRCPPKAMAELGEPLHPNLLYRFAVMAIESWVMADRKAISKFLSIPLNRIQMNTDTIERPKEHLIKLARMSRNSGIKRDVVPRHNSTSKVGPAYNDRLEEFIVERWDPQEASQHSPSLKRTFARLREFTPQ